MTTPQERVWKIAVGVGGILIAFLAVLTVKEIKSIAYVGKDTSITNTISVNGTGDAVTVPDIATFSFSVSETGKTVADAQAMATAKSNAALKALRGAGVADKDIQTTSYDINPHYDYQNAVCPVAPIMSPGMAPSSGAVSSPIYCPSGRSVLTGYDVSQTTQVKVRDLSKAGDLFTTIGSLGVQNVDSLTFSVDDIDAVKTKARGDAVADAQAKAKELASQLGVTLVRITSFYDSSDQPGPVYYGMTSGAVDVKAVPAAAPQISTGEQKVTSNVTITYEIR